MPMGRDLGDVVGRVEWARDNDAEVYIITMYVGVSIIFFIF